MKGLDTNVLIRLFLADDPEQTARGRAFVADRPAGEPLFINRIVICELVWTLVVASALIEVRSPTLSIDC